MDASNLGYAGELLLRWAHALMGTVWLAWPLFHNLVYLHVQMKLDPRVGAVVDPAVVARGLFWSTWSSALTVILGVALYLRVYWWTGDGFGNTGTLLDADGHLTDRSWWMHAGMLIGLIKWGLAFFVMEPTLRAILRNAAAGQPPAPYHLKRLQIGGGVGLILIGPVLLLMLGVHHYSSIDALLGVGFITSATAIVLLVWLAHARATRPVLGRQWP